MEIVQGQQKPLARVTQPHLEQSPYSLPVKTKSEGNLRLYDVCSKKKKEPRGRPAIRATKGAK